MPNKNKREQKQVYLHFAEREYIRLYFVPFLFAITWRRLMMCTEGHTATINNTALNDDEVFFFFCQLGKYKASCAL